MITDRSRSVDPDCSTNLADRDFPAMALLGEPTVSSAEPFANVDWAAQRAEILQRITTRRAGSSPEVDPVGRVWPPTGPSIWQRRLSWWLASTMAAAGIILAVSLLVTIARDQLARPQPSETLTHPPRPISAKTNAVITGAPLGERPVGTPLLPETSPVPDSSAASGPPRFPSRPSILVGNMTLSPLTEPGSTPDGAGGSRDGRLLERYLPPCQPLHSDLFATDAFTVGRVSVGLMEQSTPPDFLRSQHP